MIRTIAAAVAVALPSAVAFAGAQPPQLVAPPALCPHGGGYKGPQQLVEDGLYAERVPSPRWLAVTVVERRLLDPTTLVPFAVDADGGIWVGERFVDRCNIVGIAARGATGSTIEVAFYSTRGEVLRSELVVIESPKAICAALDDCAAPLLNEVDRP